MTFRRVLDSERWPHLVFLAANCSQPAAPVQLFPCLPISACRVMDRWVHSAWISSGISAVFAALDDWSKRGLPWWPWCESLRLYGFEEPGNSTLYHYWYDGSTHDGHKAAEWYNRQLRSGVLKHNFRREHELMRGKLGGNASSVGPFSILRTTVQRVCRTDHTDLAVSAHAAIAAATGSSVVRRSRPAMKRNTEDVRGEQRRPPPLTARREREAKRHGGRSRHNRAYSEA
eukprot:scaffold16099_cov117-Isochrysis_galbana.AAC.5